MKSTLKGINRKLDTVEEKIVNLNTSLQKLSKMNTEDKKNKRVKQNYISELWENVKWPNVNVIGFCKEKERDEGTKSLKKKMNK